MARKRGLIGQVVDHLKRRLSPKTMVRETIDTAAQKITQGSAEIAQALYSQSNAYVPYGDGQRGPRISPAQNAAYNRMLDSHSRTPQAGQSRGVERSPGVDR